MRGYGRYPLWVPDPTAKSEPSRGDVNRAASPRTVTVAAAGSPIPVVYGRAVISPMVFAIAVSAGRLYLGLAWCLGEINGLEAIYAGEDKIPEDQVLAFYPGTMDQGVDPTLAAVIDGYSDDLTGNYQGEDFAIAYSVLMLRAEDDFPSNLQAIVQGRKVRDHVGAINYTTSPARCLADFVESRILGLGAPVNNASLQDATTFNAEMMADDRPRATINLAITKRTSIESHLEALRAYAHCYLYEDAGEVHLVPMRPRDVDATLDGDDLVEGEIRIEQAGAIDRPNVMTVVWSDRRKWPWTDASYSLISDKVRDGLAPWRESIIQMPGLDNAAEAHRLAVRRLNHFQLVDLRVRWDGFDNLLVHTVGDVLAVSQQWGLTSKKMRVIGMAALGPGRWRMSLEEYNEGIYSDEVQTDPSLPDTGLPPPSQVPQVQGLTFSEVVYQADKGFYSSRLAISWDPLADYVYKHRFRVIVTAQAAAGVTPGVISDQLVDNQAANAGPVQEKAVYEIRVRAESEWGGQSYAGDWAVTLATAQGKFLPPGDVPELRGIEAGGEAFLEWDPAIDLDIWRYELRYGTVGVTWEQATFLDRVDALKLRSRDLPQGTWDLLIKAIDSVQQESENATRKKITVTFDPASANKARHDYQDGTAVNMTKTTDGEGNTCWVSDGGTTWDAAFPELLETYTERLVSYTVVGASSWTSDPYDWGQVIDGNWTMPDFNASQADDQDPVRIMELQDAFDVWNQFPSLAAKGGFQISRAHAEPTAPGEVLIVCIPIVRVEISSSPKVRRGQDVSLSTGPKTITLDQPLHTISSIQATPLNVTSAHVAVVDNIQLGQTPSFDVYVFDQSNAQVAVEFSWQADGI